MTEVSRRHRVDLVTIVTNDGWELDSVLYTPDSGAPSDTLLLHVHGKGATMLDAPARWLPDMLPQFSHYAFNMRNHALAYNTHRPDVPVAGGMYESLEEGKADLEAAIEFAKSEGFTRIVVCAHSSGGYYAGVFLPHDSAVVGRVLLSPLMDNKFAFEWWYPEPGQLEDALASARQLVAEGRPDELIVLPSWYWAISARSLLERAHSPDGDAWIDAVNSHPSPVLMGWGAEESRDGLWTEVYEQLTVPKSLARMENSDHWYVGHETDVTALVRQFVDSLDTPDGV